MSESGSPGMQAQQKQKRQVSLTLTTEPTTPVIRLVYLSPLGKTLKSALCPSRDSANASMLLLKAPQPFSFLPSHAPWACVTSL